MSDLINSRWIYYPVIPAKLLIILFYIFTFLNSLKLIKNIDIQIILRKIDINSINLFRDNFW